MTSALALEDLGRELTLVNNQIGKKVNVLAAVVEAPKVELTIDGASTLTFVVKDHKRELIASPVIRERSWAVAAGVHFELVGVSKSGDYLTITMEDAIVAALRRRNSPLTIPANTTNRAGITARLCREAGVPFLTDPTHPEKVHNPITRSSDGQKSNSWEVLGSDIAEPIKWRRFSDGSHLVMAGDDWLASGYKAPVELRENANGVGSIDFDLDVGKRASTAKVAIDARLRSFLPGAPVTIPALGPGSGLWIVSTFAKTLTTSRAELELVRKQHVLDEPKREKGGRGRRTSSKESGDPDFLPGQSGKDAGGTAANQARERMVRFALAQNGKPYVWGGNGPGGYDCSGLVQAATQAAGKTLGKPAASQWNTCKAAGKAISVSQALGIRGALLFRIGVSETNHVVISLGNGSTVEARGSAYGCGVFSGAASRTWTGGALWL